MATKQALMTTTAANRVSTSDIPTLTGFEVKETCPDGTATRYVVKKSGGNWQKYDASAKAWADVATQSLTAASVMTEGNTAAELNAVPKDGMTPFTGKTIDVAAAMESDDDGNLPTIDHVTVKGESGTFSLTETKDYPAITLNSNQAVDILDILVTKKETGSGTVTVYASIQNDAGWSDYAEYTTYLGENVTKAKAIKFRATFHVVNVGTDFATLTSIEVRSRTDNVAVFTEGTSACITKTYDFGNVMSRAHLVVKHHTVPDTKITAQIALRNPPKTVKDEMLGTGDGVQHTVKLANLAKLASHGFHLYFDGTEQERDTYSYSPTDGQVTYTAGAGQTVTVDYIYDWEPEKWVDMTYDNSYPDRKDDTLISEQFDYESTSDDMPTGSVGTVRVIMTQLEGKETDVALGTGTGKPVSYKLAHHARVGKIKVLPENAAWRYKENTDYLTVTAAAGEDVKVTYEWVARPLALDTLICVFDE